MSPETDITATASSVSPSGLSSKRQAMEEERDFLIRSLRDLESELAAGDIDRGDYDALRDDYTVRAAALLRRLEQGDDDEASQALVDGASSAGVAPSEVGDAGAAGEAGDDDTGVGRASDDITGGRARAAGGQATAGGSGTKRGRRGGRPWRRWELVALGGIVVALASLVGWQIGHNASHRSAGETITGANISSNTLSAAQVDQLLTQAESEATSNPVGALQTYNKILAVYPDQPQALTEQGWLYAQAGLLTQAATQLRHAETASASYDPAHGYLGIVLFSEHDYTGAVTELTYFLGHGPNPALVAQATSALKDAKVDAAAVARRTTTTTNPPDNTTTVAP